MISVCVSGWEASPGDWSGQSLVLRGGWTATEHKAPKKSSTQSRSRSRAKAVGEGDNRIIRTTRNEKKWRGEGKEKNA